MLKKNEPMVISTNQVHTTKDYAPFRAIDGNRNKNLMHINRLKESMSQNYLYTIITVNERFEIIDGQHRFEVIKELGLPLHYVICMGYGLREVHILNQNSKTWNTDDYLAGYCNLGQKDYLIYRDFKNKYKFGHNECILLLSGVYARNRFEQFFSGEFKVKSLKTALHYADKIVQVGKYYEGYMRRSFVMAMEHLLKSKNFDFEEFMAKLRLQPTALVDCTTITAYLALIEEIYNYRRREKVNLRY